MARLAPLPQQRKDGRQDGGAGGAAAVGRGRRRPGLGAALPAPGLGASRSSGALGAAASEQHAHGAAHRGDREHPQLPVLR